MRKECTPEVPPGLDALIRLCQDELCAAEVWLFGSRSRGDFREDSDWDVMAVVCDDAPESVLDLVHIWDVGRRSGLEVDLFAVKRQDFLDARDVVTTLSHQVACEGRLLWKAAKDENLEVW